MSDTMTDAALAEPGSAQDAPVEERDTQAAQETPTDAADTTADAVPEADTTDEATDADAADATTDAAEAEAVAASVVAAATEAAATAAATVARQNVVADALRSARAAERAKADTVDAATPAPLPPPVPPRPPKAQPVPTKAAAPAKAAVPPVVAAPTKAAAPTKVPPVAPTKLTPAPQASADTADAPPALVPPPSSLPAPVRVPTPAPVPDPVADPSAALVAAGDETEDTAPVTFDALLARLDAPRRALIDQHIVGLKAALATEREANKRMEKAQRLAATQADEGATLKTQVAVLEADLATTAGRADFFEAAVAQGAKRGNARLLYLAATDGSYVDAAGAVRWADLREKFPDLFESPTPAAPVRPTPPKASAGAGLTQSPTGARGLNQIIREAAGRRS